jgi:hypothetical protein
MNNEARSEELERAIKEGEVVLDESNKIAQLRTDWTEAQARATPDNLSGPLLAKKRRQLGLTAELEKLGYTVEWENV